MKQYIIIKLILHIDI